MWGRRAYRVERDEFLHMPPRMSATANEVNQAIVDADSHGESGFLHFCQVLPGIFGWVIPEKNRIFAAGPVKSCTERKAHVRSPFNGAAYVHADPAAERVHVAV